MTRGQLSTAGGEGGRVEEFDWDGNLVWELDYSTLERKQHHDIEALPNGNVLLLAVEKRTYAEVLAAGFDPAKLDPEVQQRGTMLPDMVMEIAPTRPRGGTVVWDRHVWDHLIQDYSASDDNYGRPATHPERIDADGMRRRIPLLWNHMNAVDYNADRDQIVPSVSGTSEAWVIDHCTTMAEAAGHSGGPSGKGGDLLYRWGKPVAYGAGTARDQTLFEQHDVLWIEPGRPGSGNFLAFNNGLGRNYSSVHEWISPVDAFGRYAGPSGGAFGPRGPSWTWTATPPSSMFSEAISGAHRRPNGNTLIDDGVHGILAEVPSDGAIVWRYMTP